ncbi:MAG: SCO family protein, partial [Lysobacteraceae bacterium]
AQLTDQHGRAQTFSGLTGKVRLVSMFYASCKYVCPLIIDQVKRIEAELDEGQRERLGINLITLDADNDTPEVLTRLAAERHIDSPRWQLMQPRAGDVRPISALLGIQYRALLGGDYNHSSVISLIDAEGRILARTEQLGARPDPAFVDAVRKALDASKPSMTD